MRVTRSASASLKRPQSPGPTPTPSTPLALAPAQPTQTQRKRAKLTANSSSSSAPSVAAPPAPAPAPAPTSTSSDSNTILLHPALTFSYPSAKAHLSSLDTRWATLMNKLKCTPFEFDKNDEGEEGKDQAPFDPFRSLVGSVIGQQVSWLAARSIQHKFVRLFYPHLPEKRETPSSTAPIPAPTPFPTPSMVLTKTIPELRSAGLSGRKVEYILDLATRFVDGRLCAKRLWEASDEEVMKELIAVRGVGIWTVQMFLIFSSKRPNILPVGDLGIQKALCRWYAEDPSSTPAIHARKLQKATTTSKVAERESTPPSTAAELSDPLSTPARPKETKSDPYPTPSSPSNSLAQVVEHEHETEKNLDNPFIFPPTSNGLTPAVLRSRLNGKKLKGNIYLTPTEMTELTAPWEPYRSVACWYLWSVVDGTGDA